MVEQKLTIRKPNTTLFIIGNGFDIAHGVPSTYRHFWKTMRREDTIRATMETYIKKDDIWGNVEDSLAYLDRELMLDSVDLRMDTLNVLDEDDDDFSAADFFASTEHASSPVYVLTRELPKRFRKWVNSLSVKTIKRPLTEIIDPNSRYITFNYTEFLETLYNIPKESILYIHGDRRNRKSQLVLGHGHNIEVLFNAWYSENKDRSKVKPKMRGQVDYNDNPTYLAYFLKDESKGNWKSQTRYDAIDITAQKIEGYYEDSAKKTAEVLSKSKSFFISLANIDTVIVLGHSLSEVDYPYFLEIINVNKNSQGVAWRMSWYSEEDRERIKKFIAAMGISNRHVQLFRLENGV